jgi:transposase
MRLVKKDRVRRRGEMKTWVSVVEGYRPAPGAPPKQRMIKSFGYLEDQEEPAAFMAMVEEFNRNYKAENAPLRIEVSGTDRMYSLENRKQNYGYKFLEAAYDLLSIDSFIHEHVKARKFRGDYSPSEIFKFLVLTRLLNPDSKRASCQVKNGFYGMQTEFTLPDVYRALDVFSDLEIELQRHLNEQIKKTIGRDLSHAFYDVTNYCFEIDFPDGDEDVRQRGVSKEHRVDPIAAMGLFMDGNGLPVSMSIFAGNTSDSLTLQPTMKDVKKSYGLGRVVVVADKGMNSSKNIDALVNSGDGFVFSQILKGTKGYRYRDKLFDAQGWIANACGTYQYKLFNEEYTGYNTEGKKEIRMRKVLLYWNQADANMAKRKRDEKLKKAARSVKNNAYSIKKGIDEYTKEDIVDVETGEVLENTKKLRSVDLAKANEDALYDGYFCIITSELDYDEQKIRQAYAGLWRIEQSFRIMKSDLYARPVFVSKNQHIRAHFLICFVALLVIRIIQYKMGKDALSAERISRALNAATCHVLKGAIIHLDDVGGAIAFQKRLNKDNELVDTLTYSDKDEIALDYKLIQETFGTDFYNTFHRQESFNKFLKTIVVS